MPDARSALSQILPPGASIVTAPGCGGPTTLLDALGALAHDRPGMTVRGGLLFDHPFLDAVRAGHLRYQTWHVMGAARAEVAAGRAEYLPLQASAVLRCLPAWAPDATLVRCTPPDRHGYCSLGPSGSYATAAARLAPIVVAEIDPELPRTYGDNRLHISEIDLAVETSGPAPHYRRADGDDVSRRIAARVIGLLPERPTLQLGIGTIPEALLDELVAFPPASVRFVGMACDGMVELMERGIVDPLATCPDPGVAVAELMGTSTLLAHAHENPAIGVYSSARSHNAAHLGERQRLVSVNSAFEVALDGAVNAEMLHGDPAAGVGGSNDFANAAAQSEGGRRIVALPSTTKSGRSRIVPRLAAELAATTPRHLVDVVVTEHGVAELEGRSLAERAELLTAIAAPEHRAALTDRFHDRKADPR